MPLSDLRTVPNAVQLLMNVSASLADLTQSLELCKEIPNYLRKVLAMEPLTLAIIAEDDADGPQVLLQATSGDPISASAAQALAQNLLVLYHQTKPLSHADGPAMRHEVDSTCAQLPIQQPAPGRATVLARSLDAHHRMLLIVHQAVDGPALDAGMINVLQLVADQLGRLLACLTAWHGRSEELGQPFDRLTEREWVVLRGLTSEQGEKQLADQLSLSPHTLHSHIKSIYRKTGVQGRLLLLNKVQMAMRTLRSTRLTPEKRLPARDPRVVAVG